MAVQSQEIKQKMTKKSGHILDSYKGWQVLY